MTLDISQAGKRPGYAAAATQDVGSLLKSPNLGNTRYTEEKIPDDLKKPRKTVKFAVENIEGGDDADLNSGEDNEEIDRKLAEENAKLMAKQKA